MNLKAVLDSVGVDVSDAETTNIYSLVLTQVGGTEQDLSDKNLRAEPFDCTLAFANNGKPIGSPDNGGYFTLHTTEQGSTDVAYSGVTAVTIEQTLCTVPSPATNKSNHRQKGVRQLPFSLF